MSIPKDPSSISLCAAYLGIINKTKAAGRDVESVLLFGSDAYAVEQIGPRFTDRVLFLNCHTIPWVHHTLCCSKTKPATYNGHSQISCFTCVALHLTCILRGICVA